MVQFACDHAAQRLIDSGGARRRQYFIE